MQGTPRVETIRHTRASDGSGEYRARYVRCDCGNPSRKFYVTDKYLRPLRRGAGISGHERMWCVDCDGYLGQMHQAGYGEP
jgi:hypothetical protein